MVFLFVCHKKIRKLIKLIVCLEIIKHSLIGEISLRVSQLQFPFFFFFKSILLEHIQAYLFALVSKAVLNCNDRAEL